MSSYIKVYGSKGMLEFTNFNYAGQRLTATYRTEKGAPVTNIDESTTVADPSHFVNELDHFSHCIIDNQAPKTAGEEGLKDMKYIQAIYRSAGITMG